jgi:hypothetical protein
VSKGFNLKSRSRRMVRGHREDGRPSPRVAIAFTPDMLKAIAQKARSNKTSFAQQVRQLLDVALCDPPAASMSQGLSEGGVG